MRYRFFTLLLFVSTALLMSFAFKKKIVKVYIIGDSTVADYSLEKDFMDKRYPVTGWGQVFQQFLAPDSLRNLRGFIKTDSAVVDDRAKGGRSTRTFFEEGRWTEIYQQLNKGDLVLMQFGHNDGAVDKPERYVNIAGYKEYLKLFVTQSREKGAIPIAMTPVARNYPWKDGKLNNVHGDYPQAVKEVAAQLNVPLIDLNQLSMDAFAAKGQEYVTNNYFMNLPAGKYVAYPQGQKDNTHFQTEGAIAVASLVYNAMKELNSNKK
ncbi:MAG: rhamnogalacturonan acetylesterase [Chitinophagaceae bacterium]